MPKRRGSRIVRSYKRRKLTPQRRINPTRMLTRMRPMSGPSAPHVFRRMVNTTVGGAGTAIGPNFITLNLAFLPDSTEFTNLFDLYRIKSFQVRWYLKQDPGGATTAALSYVPTLYYFPEHRPNAGAVYTTVALMEENSKCKRRALNPYRQPRCTISPSTAISVAEGGSSTLSELEWGKWIVTDQPNVNYYGMMYYIDLLPTGYNLDLQYTVILETKISA